MLLFLRNQNYWSYFAQFSWVYLGAWVNGFVTDNPFREAEAAIQALDAAAAYSTDVVTLEGDALNVAIARNGLEDFLYWKGKAKITLADTSSTLTVAGNSISPLLNVIAVPIT